MEFPTIINWTNPFPGFSQTQYSGLRLPNTVWDFQIIILTVLQDSQKLRRNLQFNWFIKDCFGKQIACKVGTALNLDLKILFSFQLFISSYEELCFYMGLLQFALGLAWTKGESPKNSYNTKPRENPAFQI